MRKSLKLCEIRFTKLDDLADCAAMFAIVFFWHNCERQVISRSPQWATRPRKTKICPCSDGTDWSGLAAVAQTGIDDVDWFGIRMV